MPASHHDHQAHQQHGHHQLLGLPAHRAGAPPLPLSVQLPPIARGLWTKSGGQHGDAAGGENDDFIEGQSIPVCFYPRCSQLPPVAAAVIGLPMPRNTLAHLIPGTLDVVLLILGIQNIVLVTCHCHSCSCDNDHHRTIIDTRDH